MRSFGVSHQSAWFHPDILQQPTEAELPRSAPRLPLSRVLERVETGADGVRPLKRGAISDVFRVSQTGRRDDVVVKRFYFPKLKHRMERWLRVDRYSRSVRSQGAVQRAGVSTPALYAHGLSGSRLAPDYAFLVFDALRRTVPLLVYWDTLPPEQKEPFARSLCRFVRRCHDGRLFLHDLIKNIEVSTGQAGWQFSLVDLACARHTPGPNLRRRGRDLAHVFRELHLDELWTPKQLLDCYMAAGSHRHRYSHTVLPFWLQWGLRRFDRRLSR